MRELENQPVHHYFQIQRLVSRNVVFRLKVPFTVKHHRYGQFETAVIVWKLNEFFYRYFNYRILPNKRPLEKLVDFNDKSPPL